MNSFIARRENREFDRQAEPLRDFHFCAKTRDGELRRTRGIKYNRRARKLHFRASGKRARRAAVTKCSYLIKTKKKVKYLKIIIVCE